MLRRPILGFEVARVATATGDSRRTCSATDPSS
jgi:hypothetical protein